MILWGRIMNTQLIMDYLTALNQNNDREWYHAHKDDYKKANAAFEDHSSPFPEI